MRFVKARSVVSALTLALGLLTLGACAEPFVYRSADSTAPTLRGRGALPPQTLATAQTTAASQTGMPASNGTDPASCPPLDFTLSFFYGGTIGGHATGSEGHFYASGELYENGNLIVQLWQPTYWPNGPANAPGAKPFSVWRGAIVDRQVHLFEQPPARCRRALEEAAGDVDPAVITRLPQ